MKQKAMVLIRAFPNVPDDYNIGKTFKAMLDKRGIDPNIACYASDPISLKTAAFINEVIEKFFMSFHKSRQLDAPEKGTTYIHKLLSMSENHSSLVIALPDTIDAMLSMIHQKGPLWIPPGGSIYSCTWRDNPPLTGATHLS